MKGKIPWKKLAEIIKKLQKQICLLQMQKKLEKFA